MARDGPTTLWQGSSTEDLDQREADNQRWADDGGSPDSRSNAPAPPQTKTRRPVEALPFTSLPVAPCTSAPRPDRRGAAVTTIPEEKMSTDFTDIRVVGVDEEHTTRADPNEPLYDVHFVLSAQPPVGWAKFVSSSIGSRGIAGRQGWPQSKYFVVRCAIGEVAKVLAALGLILKVMNRQYREWATAQKGARVEEDAFDRRERQKLQELKTRLTFD